jgi:class B acid phosphatase
MKNLLKLSAIAILAASAVSTFASNKEPYTEQGTNAREMTEQKPIH